MGFERRRERKGNPWRKKKEGRAKVFVIVFFSCGRDGGKGETNFKLLKNKSWKVDAGGWGKKQGDETSLHNWLYHRKRTASCQEEKSNECVESRTVIVTGLERRKGK